MLKHYWLILFLVFIVCISFFVSSCTKTTRVSTIYFEDRYRKENPFFKITTKQNKVYKFQRYQLTQDSLKIFPIRDAPNSWGQTKIAKKDIKLIETIEIDKVPTTLGFLSAAFVIGSFFFLLSKLEFDKS